MNTSGVSNGTGTAYPSGAHEFTPGLLWSSCYTDLRIMITPLVSSNSSSY